MFPRLPKSTANISHRAKYLTLTLIIALLWTFDDASARTPSKSDLSSLVEITIEPSRPQLTAGTELGIIAEIKNLSETTVYLREHHFVLVLPPELHNPRTQDVWGGKYGFFPTESLRDIPLALRPGDTYKVFWTTKKGSSRLFDHLADSVMSEFYFLFFPPGNYKITVVAKYWTDPKTPADDFRTITRSTILPIAAPQFVILFGASIGGLIAYFLFPHARRRLMQPLEQSEMRLLNFTFRFSKESIGIIGSVLLSIIITILLARISETQFLIRVTVNDLWGAIAIGFVANYAGSKVLSKILGEPSSDSERTGPKSPISTDVT